MPTRCFATALALLAGCAHAPADDLRLRHVVLYQNGVGYFERAGRAEEGSFELAVRGHEVDDVLTTLTVVGDSDDGEAAPVTPSAVVPRAEQGEGDRTLSVAVGEGPADVRVSYATQTSAWRASYRAVLPEGRGAGQALLQAWAVVDNTTAEDWRDVDLTLATASPLSFAVDLRTPRVVPRPNVTGHRAPPVAFGPVVAERARAIDDGDGVEGADDLCPDEPEDRDGFEDEDGCPDYDNDGDAILDVDDVCPTDGEAYNGIDDDDGCPDVGRVVITDSRITILERLYFASGSSEILQPSLPVLDAIAATLAGNPQIHRVEIHGHADAQEASPWALSAERASGVRQALVDRGVDGARLVAVPYGATQPLDAGDGAAALGRNRRVDFSLHEEPERARRAAGDGGAARAGVRAEALERSVGRSPLPRVGAGGTRYAVGRRVSVPAGESAMVAMINRRLAGEDVLLFRPDPAVPLSGTHPFRAARLDNAGGVDLVEGPISLFARGEFVGEGLLDGLRAGEVAFVPYAVEETSHVTSAVAVEEVPARALSLRRGRLRVERVSVRATRYTVEPGVRPPARLFVRHRRAAGHEPRRAPPGTERSVDAMLVPVPVDAGRVSVVAVEEERAVEATIDLLSDLSTDVRPYLVEGAIEAAAAARLRRLLDDRRTLHDLGEQVALLRTRLMEQAQRIVELRRSVASLAEATGAADVRRRLSRTLESAVADSEALSGRLAQLRVEQTEALAGLRDAFHDLTFDVD